MHHGPGHICTCVCTTRHYSRTCMCSGWYKLVPMRAPLGRSPVLMLMHHSLTCTCSCWARARAYLGTAGQVWTSRTCAMSSITTCRAAVRTMSIGLDALDERAPQARSHMLVLVHHSALPAHMYVLRLVCARAYAGTAGQVTYAYAYAPRAHMYMLMLGMCSCMCGHHGAGLHLFHRHQRQVDGQGASQNPHRKRAGGAARILCARAGLWRGRGRGQSPVGRRRRRTGRRRGQRLVHRGERYTSRRYPAVLKAR